MRRVLVVDDERVIADTLVTILIRAGYEGTAAYSGADAVREALRLEPELVISDVIMPDMTGIDASIAIQKALPSCRILLFSGHLPLLSCSNKRGLPVTTLSCSSSPSIPNTFLINFANHRCVRVGLGELDRRLSKTPMSPERQSASEILCERLMPPIRKTETVQDRRWSEVKQAALVEVTCSTAYRQFILSGWFSEKRN